MKAPLFLKSTAGLAGTFFEDALLFIAWINEEGATGFVINKPFPGTLNELTEFSNSRPFPLYDGGPVDREHLFVLHRRPDLITGGKAIGDGIYMGGEMKDITGTINNGTLSATDIRLFIGYCGWDKDELQNEIDEGSWDIVPDTQLF